MRPLELHLERKEDILLVCESLVYTSEENQYRRWKLLYFSHFKIPSTTHFSSCSISIHIRQKWLINICIGKIVVKFYSELLISLLVSPWPCSILDSHVLSSSKWRLKWITSRSWRQLDFYLIKKYLILIITQH